MHAGTGRHQAEHIPDAMIILGIESSCDETAAAIVRNGKDVLASVVRSQAALHAAYQGVVPELAARQHVESISPLLDQTCRDAGIHFNDIDGIAVTNRPGLLAALLIGVTAAKTLAWTLRKPVVGIDHVLAHLYTPTWADPPVPFPYMGLVVSGGHTAIYLLHGLNDAMRIGCTLDDAAGEAFDKVAALLGLDYPGGPAIQGAAENGDPQAIAFPRPMLDDASLNFSFSGVKTAVLYHCYGHKKPQCTQAVSTENIADIAASFQASVVDVLTAKLVNAMKRHKLTRAVIGGGVACNQALRTSMQHAFARHNWTVFFPPLSACTDNATMIAGRGYHRLANGEDDGHNLAVFGGLIR